LTLLALAAAAALALAATAQAKEIVSLKLCGASGCNILTDRDQLQGWESGINPGSQNAAGQRWYSVEVAFGDRGTIIGRDTTYWLPDSSLMRWQGQTADPWSQVATSQTAVLEKLATGVDAFTPSLARATVKGKAAADPSSYLRLFGNFPYAVLGKAKLHPVRIVLTATAPNPWVDGKAVLSYDAKRRLLIRPDGYFRLPAALGKLVMSRASLNSKATSGSGGGGSALYAGLGVGALAAVAVLGIARHKKMP